MNVDLYNLIAATYAKSPNAGSKCTDAEWYSFQDAVHGFWPRAAEILEGVSTNHPDFLIATAVDAQVREYLKITRETAEA